MRHPSSSSGQGLAHLGVRAKLLRQPLVKWHACSFESFGLEAQLRLVSLSLILTTCSHGHHFGSYIDSRSSSRCTSDTLSWDLESHTISTVRGCTANKHCENDSNICKYVSPWLTGFAIPRQISVCFRLWPIAAK